MEDKNDKERRLLAKLNIMEELLTAHKEHDLLMEQSQKAVQRLRHDMVHHLEYIQHLICVGKNMEACIYINALQGKRRYFPKGVFSGNAVVDSVLGYALYHSGQVGVKITHSIILPPHLPIEDIDLCIVFGSLAENAIEACSRILEKNKEKFIQIDAKISRGYLFISFINAFNGQVNLKNGEYRTIKLSRDRSGVGLGNVRRIISKYDGALEVSHKKDVFTVYAMLSVGKMVK